jgi:hypothetical protein
MMFAPTCIFQQMTYGVISKNDFHLGTKCQISKDSNNLVCERGSANRSPDSDIHALLVVSNELIVNRKQLHRTVSVKLAP